MGDLVELTTWPKHLSSFYKVTSSALTFEVKGYGNALVILSRKPGLCDYMITIGEHQCCRIRSNSNQESANTPGIITAEEYRKFWLTWCNGQVQLGRDGHSDAIVHCKNDDLHNIKYFTVSVLENRNAVHWRFHIPPTSEQVLKDREISGCDLHWVRYTPGDELPEEPLVGGYEKEKLYIARAGHRGSLTPGKFVPSAGKAYISWGCQANEKTDFEILCGFAGFWVPASEDKIPVEAFNAGYSEDCHERLYIGRVEHDGHLIPGKVQPSHRVCYFSYEGKEVSAKNYEILVIRRTGRCFSKINHPNIRGMIRHYMQPGIAEYDVPPSDFSDDSDEEHGLHALL